MKLYLCHKKVKAGKITKIVPGLSTFDNSVNIGVDDGTEDGDGCTVSLDWIHKHQPEVGGYVVEYGDGYLSYSPAKAFEEGYTLIEE